MGYYTSVRGAIQIVPPLTWAEIKESPFLSSPDSEYEVQLQVDSYEQETPEGTLIVRSAAEIVPYSDDSFKAYNIVKHMQALIDRHGAGHTFVGRFDCEGEETGDIWRLEIHDGRAVRITPTINWPDGEVQQGRR